ncbi:MAG: hypothetical protein ABR503_05450 [Chitinophagaceae bacterium]
MKKFFFVICLAIPYSLLLSAQDVSGFWKGTLAMRGGCFAENNIELQLTISGTSVIGTSYQYLDTANYIKKSIRGSYNLVSKTLTLQEGNVTGYKIPQHCIICVKKFELAYSKTDNTETLSGGWTGDILNTNVPCQPGTIVLSRIKESVFNEPPVPQIKVDTGDIRLDFYDNGVVDGDSITVFVNNNVVVSNQRLSAKPITAIVRVDITSPFQEVEMKAENLGSIPPNTALLLITAGIKRYRLFLTSTKTNTAIIRFVYNKEAGSSPEISRF